MLRNVMPRRPLDGLRAGILLSALSRFKDFLVHPLKRALRSRSEPVSLRPTVLIHATNKNAGQLLMKPSGVCSGAGIRTPIRSFRGCSPAVRRPPNVGPKQFGVLSTMFWRLSTLRIMLGISRSSRLDLSDARISAPRA